jgi:selenocysteine lyase/cysteine desulfurase
MDHVRSDALIERIRAALAVTATIPGPFGPRPLVYADYTASGRALDFVEAAIAARVLPTYANTHSEASFTGAQTTRFREEARQTIRQAVGADARHAVIFTGSGATAAIHKLACALGLRGQGPCAAKNPVVFVGPYEHHSNELIWRESRAAVVRIPLDADGHISLAELAAALEAHNDCDLKIGSFSAASNVTGVRTAMRPLARLLHSHGARFFADYAAAGPYVPIDMAESAPGADDQVDAIFVSPHKFVGGPGASGVLVADRALFTNAVPSVPGGGTVAFVSATAHRYIDNIEHREEAGTPAILGDIRAGLAFALKRDIGAERIEAMETALVGRVLEEWRGNPAIDVLGPTECDRLAIVSFNIRGPESMLHAGYVTALLNDLFGLQVRGGCSCAGPYGHDLLGIPPALSEQYNDLLMGGFILARPGWVRLNLHFGMTAEVVDYILAAVDFVARRGADFLSLYTADSKTGRWMCERPAAEPLGFDAICDWGMGSSRTEPPALSLADCLAEAEALANEMAVTHRVAAE